jgi:hypothetical protein
MENFAVHDILICMKNSNEIYYQYMKYLSAKYPDVWKPNQKFVDVLM